MTNTTDIISTLLRDVPTYDLWYEGDKLPFEGAIWMTQADVVAALTAALDGATTEGAKVLAYSDSCAERLEFNGELMRAATFKQNSRVIRALIAQNAAMREELNRSEQKAGFLDSEADIIVDECLDWKTRAETAEAEVERLTKQCEGLAQAAMNNGQALILAEAEVEVLRKAAENALACGFLPKDQASELRVALRSKT